MKSTSPRTAPPEAVEQYQAIHHYSRKKEDRAVGDRSPGDRLRLFWTANSQTTFTWMDFKMASALWNGTLVLARPEEATSRPPSGQPRPLKRMCARASCRQKRRSGSISRVP